MAYSAAVLQRARARLEQQNDRRRRDYEQRAQTAYARQPRLREVERAQRGVMASVLAAAFDRGTDPLAAVEEAKQKSRTLERQAQALLLEAGLPADYLDEELSCPKCGDSGYVGAQMCSCLHDLCRQEQLAELSALLPTGQECFERFDLQLYPDRYESGIGANPRKLMRENLDVCKKYAAGFSRSSGNLLFYGAPGLGKTFLSACIARQVADAGFSVEYVSAVRLFADYEAVRFGGGEADLKKYAVCDLLILDDLGTELTTQLVVSTLYTLLNTRLLERRPTIVNTNLRPDEIGTRYGPQLSSRFLGLFQRLPFAGSDIRLLLAK